FSGEVPSPRGPWNWAQSSAEAVDARSRSAVSIVLMQSGSRRVCDMMRCVTDPLQQLEELAGAAELHARQEHGIEIGLDNVSGADRVLHAESQRLDPQRVESIAACYGAWLGRLAVRSLKAKWVGLFEPAAPRLRIGGVLVSPVDAVRRKLTDPSSPPLAAI